MVRVIISGVARFSEVMGSTRFIVVMGKTGPTARYVGGQPVWCLVSA